MWHLSSNCSFFDSFKMTSRFGKNWFLVVGEIFDSVRILFQSPTLKFAGVWWWVERVLFRHISTWIEWSPEWSKKMPLQGVNWMEVTKTEGFSGVFHVMGSVMGSCKLFEVSNLYAAGGVKFWGVFFLKCEIFSKMEITRRLLFELKWKGLHGACIILRFFL